MNSRLNTIPAFALLLAVVPLAASATPALAPNGHYYEVIAANGISWVDAEAAAAAVTPHLGANGHLATITSATEDTFVESLRAAAGLSPPEAWVGGFQVLPCTPAPNCGWTWLNGEGAFVYTNWQGGEPNDNGGIEEQYLGIGLGNTPGWNDERVLGNIGGYVVEYSDYVTDADDDSAAAKSGETITINVLTNDEVDTGVGSVTIETASAFGGTAIVNGDFTIDYKSGAGFGGMDTFVYRVTANNGLTDTATVTVDVSTTVTVVVPSLNPLIYNQANVPGSNNPLTAAAQEILPGGGGETSISCCRVLDTREGAGPAKHGYFLRTDLDLGLAVGDVVTNPSCGDMPEIFPGTAIIPAWLRGVPTSRGIDNTFIARPNDLGVCAIEADILMKGVVFSEEDARNVLGYSVNCAEPNISYRPFAGGVTTSLPTEVDFPHVTTWTAECDETRSAKKYSDNVMVLNLRHDVQINPKLTYLIGLKLRTWQSIYQAKAAGCVDNSTGFLNKLLDLTARAGADILLQKGEAAVLKLDNATRLALLIPTIPAGTPLVGDPYREGEAACPGNPKGLFVGRLMALKFATCSELVQAGPGENSQSPAACAIAGDILDALPPLPTIPTP